MNAAPVVCPLCPLHCDDLSADQLAQGRTGCAVADKRMQAVLRTRRQTNQTGDLETCRQWLREAKRIVVSGLAMDLETARAIAQFARETGASVDMTGCNPMALDVFAREGSFQTTLGELAAREVSVLAIGDVAAHWPRMEQRLRQVSSTTRWADSDALLRRLAALRLQLAGRYLPSMVDGSEGAADPEVAEAVERIRATSYLVVVIAPLRESVAHSPVLWSTIAGLVRERNKTARAAMLSFDPSLTVRSVLAARNDPPRLLASGHDDALRIELTPFAEMDTRAAQRTILIGTVDQVLRADQRLLAASVPGLHHAGIVIRGDGSVTLPLQSCLSPEQSLFTPAEQLRKLIGSNP